MTDNINYPHIVEYLNKTLPESGGILKELEDYAKEHTVPIIQKEVRSFLGMLLKYKAPKNILELGTAIGYSSIFFSEHILPGGKITTLEREDDYYALANENIKKAVDIHIH